MLLIEQCCFWEKYLENLWDCIFHRTLQFGWISVITNNPWIFPYFKKIMDSMCDISNWIFFLDYCITRKVIHDVIGCLCFEWFSDEFFFKIEKNQNFFNFRSLDKNNLFDHRVYRTIRTHWSNRIVL